MIHIVSIAWYKILPPKFGGQKGIALFNKYLAKRYSFTCLCSKNNKPGDDINYKVIPSLPVSKRQFMDPFCWEKIKRITASENATHILLEHPYYAIAAYRAAKAIGVRLILHAHNIEFLRFRQMGKWWWRLLYYYEKWAHRKADLVLFKTLEEKEYAINQFAIEKNKCLVIPYGIEKSDSPDHDSARQFLCKQYGIKENEKILAFAGTLDYEPNAKAVENIYKEIAPRLDKKGFYYKIILCGRNKDKRYRYLQQLSHPAVIHAGEVEDIGIYLAGADSFINPVQTGGGVQTKNIEALAHHGNVVGFESKFDTDAIEKADEKIFAALDGDWEHFANQIIKSAAKREMTSSAFFDYYYWENIIDRLASKIEEL